MRPRESSLAAAAAASRLMKLNGRDADLVGLARHHHHHCRRVRVSRCFSSYKPAADAGSRSRICERNTNEKKTKKKKEKQRELKKADELETESQMRAEMEKEM